ncbi:MAG: 3'(2'),5'-bisphosphate nucleotidase CysQ [Rhodocyclaceae bacterium]|nr:3'(2'),5'-bisphosphate nucleotidase CysQ [Rhodocyclaceae bacterium]
MTQAVAGLSPVQLLERLAEIARAAGEVIMQIYAQDFAVRTKADDSPVTQADELAEALITRKLTALAPDIPLVAEEAVAAGNIPAVGERFWLVDPLDGTREFLAKNGEFTVNIALVEQGRPAAGLVFAPALDELYAGAPGHAAWQEIRGARTPLAVRVPPAEGLTVLGSRSHGDPAELARFVAAHKVARVIPVGSSLKLCHIAAARGDLYARLGPTMEWDIAAGHAVLLAAGGHLNAIDGGDFLYGKPGFRNPQFVARGLN